MSFGVLKFLKRFYMTKRKLRKKDRLLLKRLGRRIKRIILKERGYSSLDAFSLECGDVLSKTTLYRICDGVQDPYFLSIMKICEALDVSLIDLLNDVLKEDENKSEAN